MRFDCVKDKEDKVEAKRRIRMETRKISNLDLISSRIYQAAPSLLTYLTQNTRLS
jgi:hypothetical protein